MGDILADIDAAADEWDSWDGRSADAARWVPDGRVEVRAGGVRVWFGGVDLSPFVESMRLFGADLNRRLAVIDAVPLSRYAAAAPAETPTPAYLPRPSTVPPMWAVVPTRERRRRAG